MRILWYTQHDKLKFEEVNMADIGDKLKSAREAKGLSIADIEKATKIQSRYPVSYTHLTLPTKA